MRAPGAAAGGRLGGDRVDLWRSSAFAGRSGDRAHCASRSRAHARRRSDRADVRDRARTAPAASHRAAEGEARDPGRARLSQQSDGGGCDAPVSGLSRRASAERGGAGGDDRRRALRLQRRGIEGAQQALGADDHRCRSGMATGGRVVHHLGLPPHVAIGTSAVAVAASSLANLGGHARARTVKWPCATVFAVAGAIGAAIGAQIGKRVDGQVLLAAFGVLMVVIAGLMLRHRRAGHDPDVRLTLASAPRLLPPLAGTGRSWASTLRLDSSSLLARA